MATPGSDSCSSLTKFHHHHFQLSSPLLDKHHHLCSVARTIWVSVTFQEIWNCLPSTVSSAHLNALGCCRCSL
jgi:hypothetical protein